MNMKGVRDARDGLIRDGDLCVGLTTERNEVSRWGRSTSSVTGKGNACLQRKGSELGSQPSNPQAKSPPKQSHPALQGTGPICEEPIGSGTGAPRRFRAASNRLLGAWISLKGHPRAGRGTGGAPSIKGHTEGKVRYLGLLTFGDASSLGTGVVKNGVGKEGAEYSSIGSSEGGK